MKLVRSRAIFCVVLHFPERFKSPKTCREFLFYRRGSHTLRQYKLRRFTVQLLYVVLFYFLSHGTRANPIIGWRPTAEDVGPLCGRCETVGQMAPKAAWISPTTARGVDELSQNSATNLPLSQQRHCLTGAVPTPAIIIESCFRNGTSLLWITQEIAMHVLHIVSYGFLHS